MRVRRHQNGLCAESGTEQRSAPGIWADYGTMQMRGEDGAWYEVIRDDEGEEET